jgi:hypothetical protein
MPWLARLNPQIDWRGSTVALTMPDGSVAVLRSKDTERPDFLMSAAQLRRAE